MSFFKRHQTIFIVAAVLVAAFVLYSAFFKGDSAAVLETKPVSETTAVDRDLIALLLELRSLKLDEKIFTDPSFQSLVDFGRELVPEALGRTNPFEPLEQ